jgi:hypothetical protein
MPVHLEHMLACVYFPIRNRTYSVCRVTEGRPNSAAFTFTALIIHVNQHALQCIGYTSFTIDRNFAYMAKVGTFATSLIVATRKPVSTGCSVVLHSMVCAVQSCLVEQQHVVRSES